MQQQLMEAETMQAVGRLAYGVAHEIRNPLNILQTGLEFLAGIASSPENSPQLEIVQEMKSAVSRADSVIGALMETTSPSAFKPEKCDVRELLDEVLTIIKEDVRSSGIVISRDFSSDLVPVKVDRAKMEQVFKGIVVNAIDAMPGGGELSIRARLKQLGAADIQRDAGSRFAEKFRAEDRVMLVEVEDTGTGIAPEVLTRIFDPFFTTKETGHGTGLGLTVCRKLTDLHGGIIQISNRTDRSGVRVAVLLPLAM